MAQRTQAKLDDPRGQLGKPTLANSTPSEPSCVVTKGNMENRPYQPLRDGEDVDRGNRATAIAQGVVRISVLAGRA
jgi:hypothetical protein